MHFRSGTAAEEGVGESPDSECLSAASAAEVLWAPDSRKIKNLDRRIKKLFRKEFALYEKLGRHFIKAGKRLHRILDEDEAHANTLVIWEIFSLRCVGDFDLFFNTGPKPKDPVS